MSPHGIFCCFSETGWAKPSGLCLGSNWALVQCVDPSNTFLCILSCLTLNLQILLIFPKMGWGLLLTPELQLQFLKASIFCHIPPSSDIRWCSHHRPFWTLKPYLLNEHCLALPPLCHHLHLGSWPLEACLSDTSAITTDHFMAYLFLFEGQTYKEKERKRKKEILHPIASQELVLKGFEVRQSMDWPNTSPT